MSPAQASPTTIASTAAEQQPLHLSPLLLSNHHPALSYMAAEQPQPTTVTSVSARQAWTIAKAPTSAEHPLSPTLVSPTAEQPYCTAIAYITAEQQPPSLFPLLRNNCHPGTCIHGCPASTIHNKLFFIFPRWNIKLYYYHPSQHRFHQSENMSLSSLIPVYFDLFFIILIFLLKTEMSPFLIDICFKIFICIAAWLKFEGGASRACYCCCSSSWFGIFRFFKSILPLYLPKFLLFLIFIFKFFNLGGSEFTKLSLSLSSFLF